MENTLLELYHIGCRVSSEFYLRDISLTLKAGECIAIMGRNASGKSTLFSLLLGLYQKDSGEVYIDGKKMPALSPQEAVSQGILLLGQNQPMFRDLKVYENIYFGNEITKGRILDNAKMRQEATALLARLNIPVNPMAVMGELGYAQQQLVQLAKAVCSGTRLVLLDEPSAHMDAAGKKSLWAAVQNMKKEGRSFLYITHDPEEVLAVADQAAFMENGILSPPEPVTGMDEEILASRAYGIRPGGLYERARVALGEEVLRVDSPDISFSLRQGEVAALLGDNASAQGLLSRIGGMFPMRTGTITVNGKKIEPSPLSAVENGVSLALDERAEEELEGARELLENGKKNTPALRALFRIRQAGSSISGAFSSWLGMTRKGEYMTGGNRRREMMERALGCKAQVYLLMDPSAGMDMPSRARLYARFGSIAQERGALLFVTGNWPEAVGLADRLLVLRNGKLVCDVPAETGAAQAKAFLEGEG